MQKGARAEKGSRAHIKKEREGSSDPFQTRTSTPLGGKNKFRSDLGKRRRGGGMSHDSNAGKGLNKLHCTAGSSLKKAK